MSSRSTLASSQPGTGRRLRVKRACEPCKNRKKRCNGAYPCSTCVRLEYDCSYSEKTLHHPGSASANQTSVDAVRAADRSATPSQRRVAVDQARKANSSKALVQQLGNEVRPAVNGHEPLTFDLASSGVAPVQPEQIQNLVTYDQMKIMSDSFFTTVHPVYGFLQRDLFDAAIFMRWTTDDVRQHDTILCYVAALGALFGTGRFDSQQQRLVQYANNLLEHQIATGAPNAIHVAALALKTMLFRCTALPHAAWLTSCVAVHTMDAIDDNQRPDFYRVVDVAKLRWIVHLQDFWISNEAGKPHVGTLHPNVTDPEHNWPQKPSILVLFRISLVLDPDRDHTSDAFREAISETAIVDSEEDAFKLSQTNLALVLYRRFKAMDCTPCPETCKQVLSVIRTGLTAASRLAGALQPWWHVANVPFQCLCTLLIMDDYEALSLVPVALETLKIVTEAFRIDSVAAAYHRARQLVEMVIQKKEQDVGLLKKAFDSPQSHDKFTPSGSLAWPMDSNIDQTWLLPEIDAQMDQYVNLNWFPSLETY